MNTYTFICDVGYGVEEFYTITLMAETIMDAINSFELKEWKSQCDGVPIEELPDRLTSQDLSDMIDQIIEILPNNQYRKWDSYAYFMVTHDENHPYFKFKHNFIQAIREGIETHNKEFTPKNILS